MRTKLIALAGAILLLAACETDPEDAADAGGGGDRGTEAPQVERDPGTGPEVIPTEDPLTPQEQLVQNVGDRVFFDYDRYTVRPDGQATLRRQAQFLKVNGNFTITISGHCDERGTREYNLALGERRATAAKNFLVSLGIDASRIRTISYGKERPIVLGHTEAAWAQNRVGISSIN
ncbi:MAG: peptidoglycan-associated lipoprotein Pal [Alphaproteobacteria bacterium]|jgi:peptidoglycan-associated lipoprotein|nr:peptidoglycan-associated lipoprotein Pal [Alphaproteobacteria bacterium]